MAASLPRVVVVLRASEYELLLARHATHAQAAFFLEQRRQAIEDVQRRHQTLQRALQQVSAAIPSRWRRTRVRRDDLARFLFEPEDVVVVVGQDGLVANVAKYLDGQPVIGINPDAERYDGILVPHPPAAFADLLADARAGRAPLEERTMVQASLDDGQRLVALNEVFVGVRTHQSARYRIRFGEAEERHSSSGLIVATGTGATGWARSIRRQRASFVTMPQPEEEALVFFVREAFPSVATGTQITEGRIELDAALEVVSENEAGGAIFGDGIEADYLAFDWGQRVRVEPAERRLHLVAG